MTRVLVILVTVKMKTFREFLEAYQTKQPNPVAKNIEKFNKPKTHSDKKKKQKKGYRKHKGSW